LLEICNSISGGGDKIQPSIFSVQIVEIALFASDYHECTMLLALFGIKAGCEFFVLLMPDTQSGHSYKQRIAGSCSFLT
jgi:hypothetical protein